MDKYKKKFFKINFIIGILCLAIMITFIIFLTKLNSEEKYFLAALTVMVLFFPVVLVFLVKNIIYCLKYFKLKKLFNMVWMAFAKSSTINLEDIMEKIGI